MRPLITRTYRKGDVLFREGEGPGPAFLIISGKVGVTAGGEPGTEVAIIGENGIVGEMSIIDDSPRSATVTAAEELTCYVIDRIRFHELFEGAHPIAKKLFEIQTQRLRKATKQLTSS